MAQPITLHSAYSGMAQDYTRDQLPPGAVWNMVDFFPNVLGAPLRKRGGWVNASSAITAASFLRRVFYGVMELSSGSGSKMLAIDSVTSTSAGPSVWSVNETSGAVTQIGGITSASAGTATGSMIVGDPVFFGKRLFIPVGYSDSFPNATSATSYARCAIFDGTTLSKIGIAASVTSMDSPSGARYIGVYKNRVMLANGPLKPRKIWFAKAGKSAQDTFDDPLAQMQVPMQITGLSGLANALLVFGSDRTIRIRGSIPPPGSDFVVENLNDHGCADSRSIATWAGKCVYADTDGVYLTDAIDTVDLTAKAGLSLYYRNLLVGFTSTWRLRGAVFRNYYFLCVADASGTFVDCLVCDLSTRSWFRLSNFNFEDLYVGTGDSFNVFLGAHHASNRVIRATDIFVPAAANKADADGTAIQPYVEYPARRGFIRQFRRWIPSQGLTKWLRLYLGYDLRDAASDNPTLTVSYVTTPEASSYTALSRSFAESASLARGALSFGPSGARGGKTSTVMAVKVAQVGNSSDTRIYTLEAEQGSLEGSRLVQ